MAAQSELCRRTVILTDGNERSALAIARALAAIGCRVIVGAEDPVCLTAASRFCSTSFVYPSPYKDPSGFVSAVRERTQNISHSMVLPVTDITTKLLCQHGREFEGDVVIACPPTEAFERLSDKYNLMQLAESLDVPIPHTIFVPNGDVHAHFCELRSFPVVVKPGCSLTSAGKQWVKTGVLYANSVEDLTHLYMRHTFLKHPSLIQERIEGEGQGLFTLMKNGAPIALFAHRRVRERPPSGGVSVLSESIPLPENMVRHALRLLQHVQWNGVAMVEFKIDRVTGQPFLMEVNGRFWGSLQLAIDAGVDFPVLLYKLLTEGDFANPPGQYKVGVQLRWLLGDLDHLLLRLFKEDRFLPPSSPSRAATLKSFLKFSGRDLQYDVYQRDDVGPFWLEAWQYIEDLKRSISLCWRRFRSTGKKIVLRTVFAAGFRRWILCKWIPPNVNHILVLCHGNVCRSPLAEMYLKCRFEGQSHGVTIASAGLNTQSGRPPHPFAVHVAEQVGLELNTHVSTQVTRSLIDRADLILVMDDTQLEEVAERFPDARKKTIPLGYFNREAPKDIADPFFGPLKDFKTCFALIKNASDDLSSYLVKN